MELVTGMMIGDGYSIIESMAQGSIGTVYKASQPNVGRLVALRVLPSELTAQQSFLDRFQRDAQVIAALRHTNVVPLLDYGEQEGIAYLVSELVAGGTVADLSGASLGALGVATILNPVAAALDYIHAHGLVHGSIKPSNIFLIGNSRPLLADVGLLDMVTDGRPVSGSADANGLQAAKSIYMAPEIARDDRLTASADIFALAAIAAELRPSRTLSSLDDTGTPTGGFEQQTGSSAGARNATWPAAVDDVLLRALSREPAERYATAVEFVTAFALAARIEGVTSPPVYVPAPPPATAIPEPPVTVTLEPPVIAVPAMVPHPVAETVTTAAPATNANAVAPPVATLPTTSAAPKPGLGAGENTGATSESPGSPASEHRKPVPWPLLAGIGGAVLLLLIGIFAVTRHSGNNVSVAPAATSTATSAGTVAPTSVATAAAAPTVQRVVKTPLPVVGLLTNPGTWRLGQSMHVARGVVCAAVLHDGRVLVMGGWGANGPLADAELFDPASGNWTVTGSMHVARHYFTATVLPDGRVLVAGGSDSESYLADAEVYDPQRGTWTVTGSMQTPRDEHVAALLPNGTVLVAGGETTDTTPVNSAEVYDPRTGRWSPAPPMSTARWDATATLLANGTVLVAGGGTANAEIYSSVTKQWKTTGPMASVRYRHTATLLANHTVLVAGGETAFTSLLDTAEIFDPQTNAWTVAGTMPHPHSRHTAILLPSGEVLVAGGSTGKDPQVSLESGTGSVDIYDLSSHRWSSAGSMRTNRAEHAVAPISGGRILQIGGNTSQGTVTATTDIYTAPASR